MIPFPIAKKVSRPSILVFLAALVLAWTGGSSASAGESAASLVAPDFEAFLSSQADCAVPTNGAAELPEQAPAGQPKSGSVTCSPYCGDPRCRGQLVGGACESAAGGTCFGPYLGRQCIDGLPWCYCA